LDGWEAEEAIINNFINFWRALSSLITINWKKVLQNYFVCFLKGTRSSIVDNEFVLPKMFSISRSNVCTFGLNLDKLLLHIWNFNNKRLILMLIWDEKWFIWTFIIFGLDIQNLGGRGVQWLDCDEDFGLI